MKDFFVDPVPKYPEGDDDYVLDNSVLDDYVLDNSVLDSTSVLDLLRKRARDIEGGESSILEPDLHEKAEAFFNPQPSNNKGVDAEGLKQQGSQKYLQRLQNRDNLNMNATPHVVKHDSLQAIIHKHHKESPDAKLEVMRNEDGSYSVSSPDPKAHAKIKPLEGRAVSARDFRRILSSKNKILAKMDFWKEELPIDKRSGNLAFQVFTSDKTALRLIDAMVNDPKLPDVSDVISVSNEPVAPAHDMTNVVEFPKETRGMKFGGALKRLAAAVVIAVASLSPFSSLNAPNDGVDNIANGFDNAEAALIEATPDLLSSSNVDPLGHGVVTHINGVPVADIKLPSAVVSDEASNPIGQVDLSVAYADFGAVAEAKIDFVSPADIGSFEAQAFNTVLPTPPLGVSEIFDGLAHAVPASKQPITLAAAEYGSVYNMAESLMGERATGAEVWEKVETIISQNAVQFPSLIPEPGKLKADWVLTYSPDGETQAVTCSSGTKPACSVASVQTATLDLSYNKY